MIVEFIYNVLLKSIYSPFRKLPKRAKRGTKANMSKGRSSRANLKCAKKGSVLELLALIIYNKNQHKEFYSDDKYDKCPTPQINH
jgi:hypothetical protein